MKERQHACTLLLPLLLLMPLACDSTDTTAAADKGAQPEIDEPKPETSEPASNTTKIEDPRSIASKVDKPEPIAATTEEPTPPDEPLLAEKPESPAIDHEEARKKYGLPKRAASDMWSPKVPGLTAFEVLVAVCLDYQLAADVAGEKSSEQWTAYVAKRKKMKTKHLASVYTAWMAFALGSENEGADPSMPEVAYCTWD